MPRDPCIRPHPGLNAHHTTESLTRNPDEDKGARDDDRRAIVGHPEPGIRIPYWQGAREGRGQPGSGEEIVSRVFTSPALQQHRAATQKQDDPRNQDDHLVIPEALARPDLQGIGENGQQCHHDPRDE